MAVIFGTRTPSGSTSRNQLSSREDQILAMAMDGLTDKEIAHKLELSTATVKSYWVRIRQKVGGLNRTETVAKHLSSKPDKDAANMEGLLDAVCLFAPWGMLVVDKNAVVTFASRPGGLEKTTDIIGRSILDLCPSMERALISLHLSTVFEDAKPVECTLRLCLGRGPYTDFTGRLAPVEDSNGVSGAIFFISARE